MTKFLKRSGAALLSLVLLCVLAIGAGAAASQTVGVKFWKERSDKESMANTGVDSDRTATLTHQANGTYTLTLPVKQVSKMGVTGSLSGLTIGDVTYNGTVTGDVTKATEPRKTTVIFKYTCNDDGEWSADDSVNSEMMDAMLS